ncbi:MAG: hypothetical protein K8F91_17655 [Candidatus Obscuribacterales bacterium]|nr:hypothetical protein [Candidatus Obscuribacterales bacterium]
MKTLDTSGVREVALPFSDGLLSARLWKAYGRSVVGVPELGLHCYGNTETEAVFRLFTALLKYYRQLKANQSKITEKGRLDLEILTHWVKEIEKKMTMPETAMVVPFARRTR